jgi:DNA-binding CsgD family transcriptional regulator
MKIVDVDPRDTSTVPARALHAVIDSVGGPGYAPVLMQCFSDAVQADVWSLVRLQAGAPVSVEMAVGRQGEGPWRETGRRFVRLYGPFDPMRSVAPAALAAPWQVGQIESRDIHHPAYRDCCYDAPRIHRRLSTRIQCRSGDFQVNAYGFADGGFALDTQAVAGFVEVTKLLAVSVDRHLKDRAPARTAPSNAMTPADLRQRLSTLDPRLSRREIDVLALAACGRSVAASAAALGLGVTSVSTYRRRGLAKLEVGNAAQLLQVLLRQAVACHREG